MAIQALKVTLGAAESGGGYSTTPSGTSQPAAPATATVAANVATLVADGASPTQAHVTTLNGNWTTLKALVDAVSVAPTGDLVILYDDSVITDGNKFAAALRGALRAAASRGLVIRQ